MKKKRELFGRRNLDMEKDEKKKEKERERDRGIEVQRISVR